MGDHLREAEALARTLGDQHRLGADRHLHGDPVPGHWRLRRGRQIRPGGPEPSRAPSAIARSRWSPRTLLGLTHVARGEFSDAATLLERNVALEGDLRARALRGGRHPVGGLGRLPRRRALAELGRVRRGHRARPRPPCRSLKRPIIPTRCTAALFGLGLAHLRRGRSPARDPRSSSGGLDLCRTWQIVVAIPLVAAALGAAYALAGRADEALPLVGGRRRGVPTSPDSRLAGAAFFCARARPASRPGGSTRRAEPRPRGAGAQPPAGGSGQRGPRPLPRR